MKAQISLNRQTRPNLVWVAAVAGLLTFPGTTSVVMSADKATLKVVKADSEETAGENGSGTNAVDGDPATFWHTQWQDTSPEHPHEIVIELSRPCRISGFTYLPRQDDE